jgi:hypothetical protein
MPRWRVFKLEEWRILFKAALCLMRAAAGRPRPASVTGENAPVALTPPAWYENDHASVFGSNPEAVPCRLVHGGCDRANQKVQLLETQRGGSAHLASRCLRIVWKKLRHGQQLIGRRTTEVEGPIVVRAHDSVGQLSVRRPHAKDRWKQVGRFDAIASHVLQTQSRRSGARQWVLRERNAIERPCGVWDCRTSDQGAIRSTPGHRRPTSPGHRPQLPAARAPAGCLAVVRSTNRAAGRRGRSDRRQRPPSASSWHSPLSETASALEPRGG